jgi:signal transduction histidine kinase
MGRIVFSTTEMDSEQVVAGADNGTGIRFEDQERIFEMFYTTKPPGKGTGLGLTITANLVQRLGGRITVDSQPGKGATFTVYLPVG